MTSLLGVALEYYDRNKELYENIINKIAYIEGDSVSGSAVSSSLIFYDSDEKILFRSKYGIIGTMFDVMVHRMWVWGWAQPSPPYEIVAMIKNVLIHGISLTNSTGDIANIKLELITSRFNITDNTQVDIYCAIASYFAKIPLVIQINLIPQAGQRISIKPPGTENYVSTYIYIMEPPPI